MGIRLSRSCGKTVEKPLTFPKEKMRELCTENLIFQKFFELLQDFHDVSADAGLVNAIDMA